VGAGARLAGPVQLDEARERESTARSWRAVVVPFVVSRALSDALLVAMGMLRGRPSVLAGFGRWDGRWYQAIALHGYSPLHHAHHHQMPWPFFPLFPLIMRAGATTGISTALAGIAFNHLCFLAALVAIHRLAVRHVSPQAASIAVWLTALGPLAFVFSMLYPSAVFLAASAWAFLALEERHDLTAGLAGAAAALARPNGIIVVVVLVVATGFAVRRVVRVAGPAAIAIGGWIAYNTLRTGDALRFLNAKQAWREVNFVGFVEHPTPNAALHFAVAALALVLVCLCRRRFPPTWTWYTAVYLVPSLALGIVGLARYATETFPPYIAAGTLIEKRPQVIGWVIGSLVVSLARSLSPSRGVGPSNVARSELRSRSRFSSSSSEPAAASTSTPSLPSSSLAVPRARCGTRSRTRCGCGRSSSRCSRSWSRWRPGSWDGGQRDFRTALTPRP